MPRITCYRGTEFCLFGLLNLPRTDDLWMARLIHKTSLTVSLRPGADRNKVSGFRELSHVGAWVLASYTGSR